MAITIHDLAIHRGIKPSEPGGSSYSGGEYIRVGLPFMGGCERCQAQLAAYNAYPSKSGMLRCFDCIGSLGYETVEESNEDIFGAQDDDEMTQAIERIKRVFPNAVEVDE